MQVGLAVIDGCFASGTAAIVDVLHTAESVRESLDPSIPPIEVRFLGPRRRVTSGAGLIVPTDGSLAELGDVDVAVVAALGTMNGPATVDALRTRDGRALVAAVDAAAARSRVAVAAACTGTFAVAEAGLLDNGRATTSWWLGSTFRNRYPSVELDLGAMVVHDQRVTTVGAAFAHVDLALTLVREISPLLAHHVARLLVVDERTSQSSYLAIDHLHHDDDLVRAFERYLRTNLARPIDLAVASHAIGTSRRTLERHLRHALGMSPTALVQRLRVERAEHLLRTGQTVERVAPQVGYSNASTLRTLIRRHR